MNIKYHGIFIAHCWWIYLVTANHVNLNFTKAVSVGGSLTQGFPLSVHPYHTLIVCHSRREIEHGRINTFVCSLTLLGADICFKTDSQENSFNYNRNEFERLLTKMKNKEKKWVWLMLNMTCLIKLPTCKTF